VGLVLVLDLLSGADLALDGVLWALAAMLGAATYFVMSADTRSGVPPLALAGGGLAVGAVGLGALGLVGILPMRATTAAPTYGGEAVAWWLPFVGPRRGHRGHRLHDRHRGEPAARLAAGLVRGAARGRRRGHLRVAAARPAPGHLQLVGGAFIVAGVIVVKLGERPPRANAADARPVPAPGLPVAAGRAE
jgi:drug/metabolite transporter (DMT)-like permease